MYEKFKNMDPGEIELPETVFVRDIETRVFQAIVLHALSGIDGVGFVEGNLFDSLLGREIESVKGIHVEPDLKQQSVSIRVEVHIAHQVSIPEKAEEIQSRIVEEVGRWTGLHVAKVHIVFKDLLRKTVAHAGERDNAF